jgi:BirA family transcriptional regulator, biotin operon repressor / biotin---[acetyl-CoA-carboxylase] ligase
VQQGVSARLEGLLSGLGNPWPAPIEHLPTIGSTNDYLKDRARSGAPEWTVVVADRQTAGRGREGRSWVSPSGNLYLSVLLRPAFEPLTLLPLAAGVAVAEALQPFGVQARLKWPNDVEADGKKIAGVLTESAAAGGGAEWVVIGMGVNLYPDEPLPETATSLRAVTGGEETSATCREAMAASVLARLAVWYDALRHGAARAVVAAWRERALPWWGRTVEAGSGDLVLRGVARGLDDRGALVLELPDGSHRAVFSGEVREVRLSPRSLRP